MSSNNCNNCENISNYRSLNLKCNNNANTNTNIISSIHNLPCNYDNINVQKRIQNVVRVSTSLYLDNLSALTVRGNISNKPEYTHNNVNQSQASDRNVYHLQSEIVNRKINYHARPGRLGPGGLGVDVKHNSFNRILLRKKAQHLTTDNTTNNPSYGNRKKKYGIVNNCVCNNNFNLSFF